MSNSSLTEKCNDILNFWKLEEYFTPSDYPKLLLKIKEGENKKILMHIMMLTVTKFCH